VERLLAESAARLHAAGHDAVTEEQLLAAIIPPDDPRRRQRDSYKYAMARMRRRGLFGWIGPSAPQSFRLTEKAYRELRDQPPDTPLIVNQPGDK
jgi:predicted amidohydrolase YtcJ